jgi:hypothetical protein
MISEGLFQTQLNKVEHILNELDLLEERQPSPNLSLGASHFRGMSYRQIYEECVREYAYEYRLTDQSLLLFVKSGSNVHNGSLSYSYLDCPVKVMPYREFVGNEIGMDVMDENFDEEVDSWGDQLFSDYDQYINSLNNKSTVTPLRYDYKASDYRAGIHPASHVHFGHENEIRVGTNRVMRPLSFLLFLLRQRYPAEWDQLRNMRQMSIYVRNVRSELDLVESTYWSERDQDEIFLH